MAVLVDYACPTCAGRTEAWVPSPPPTSRPCPACGTDAKRVWAAVGYVSRRGERPSSAPARTPAHASKPLCVTNPDVPGLCHMSESAGRAWVARARGDNRALDRELERQERAAAVKPPTLTDVVAHSHHPGHDHGHAHSPDAS